LPLFLGNNLMAKKTKKPGRPKSEGLTPRQRHTLQIIVDFIKQWGHSPTMQQLADELGIKAASVHDQVTQLVEKRYLQREPGRSRGLTVLRHADEPISDLVGIPIVGPVAAGYPVLAEENIRGEVLVDEAMVGKGPCFALDVTGNSMKQAGIADGDMVIVRQQPIAEKNDIVVALVDGESTIKRLYIDDDTIELRPENSKFRPIPIGPETDLRILGKVVAVKRPAKKRRR
jgi:repressor LexA